MSRPATPMMHCLSYLFVPASRPERFPKALASGADAVIVDLEDAVAPDAKVAARAVLESWLKTAPARVIVRINGADTPWFAEDLALCAQPAVHGVIVPKAERVDDLARVVSAAPGRELLPLIETAVGFDRARSIALAPGVTRLVFGSIDFQHDMNIRGDDEELLFFRSRLVLDSRLAGIDAPVDGVCTAIDDAQRLEAESLRARRLGFGAKLCIHPRQVDVINRAFSPGADEIAWAQRVLQAAAQAHGAAVALDGTMVDRPVILRAEAIVREISAREQQRGRNL
jgi:citrate lyase subunit beta / citryl-CoA lyase